MAIGRSPSGLKGAIMRLLHDSESSRFWRGLLHRMVLTAVFRPPRARFLGTYLTRRLYTPERRGEPRTIVEFLQE